MGKTAKIKELIRYEKPIEVVKLTNEKYRVGFCSRCGACCKTINMDTKGSEAAIEWLKLHGVKVTILGGIKTDPREEANEFTLSISLPCQCTELALDEEQKCICQVYEDRPIICKYYPKQYAGFQTCTYMFLNTEELNKFAADYTEYWRSTHGKEKTIKITN